jgi:hypothetical protein
LQQAVRLGYGSIVNLLLDSGVDVNEKIGKVM